MSSNGQPSKKQAINLYGVYNEELARMHELMKTYMTLPREPSSPYGRYTAGGNYTTHSELPVIYERIQHLQNILIAALQSHDPLIQEKVAELALTSEVEFPKNPPPD